jgi:aryl-alcohol dehydrogenase-like predicted oxidoreductase
MKKRSFKPFGNISALTLGGGGLGQVWGETSREEAVATVNLALENGINHFDVAPMYGNGEAESVIGDVFKGKAINDIRITTKCSLGTLPDEKVYDRLNKSLTESLNNLNMEKVDLFLLHSQLREDDFQLQILNSHRDALTTSLSCYFNAVIPAFEKLKAEGKIISWGIGGIGQNKAVIDAINYSIPPEAIQCVINPLNSAGAIGYVDKAYDPNSILKTAQESDIPILGIRAVQAGALTSQMDREPHKSGRDVKDFEDYVRAEPFREFAKEYGDTPSHLAHRYALSIHKISSIILGVKNRKELLECLDAELMEPLTQEEIDQINTVLSAYKDL